MSCCETIYNAGCYYTCTSVNLGILAPSTGDYTIIWEQFGGENILVEQFDTGQPINLVNVFNEDAEVVVRITDQTTGQPVTGPGGEECIKFRIKPIVSQIDNTPA